MDMRVDHAGDHHAPLPIQPEIDHGAFIPAPQHRHNLSLIVEYQPGEAQHLAFAINRHAIDIVDQRIGQRRGRKGEQRAGGKGKSKGAAHGFPLGRVIVLGKTDRTR